MVQCVPTLLYAQVTSHTRIMADNGKSIAWHTDRRKTKIYEER